MADDAEALYRPAALQALKAFPVEAGALAFANISENVTFKVTAARDGAHYVLRLHRPWYHGFEALKSERVWTRALAAAGVATPPPVPTIGGEDYVRVAIEATGEARYAGLARWIDGDILFEVMSGEADDAAKAPYFERLGAIMAAMHNQACAWTPPAGFVRHRLDQHGLMGEAPFWGPFWDHAVLTPGERSLLLSTRDQIRVALERLGQHPATWSLIHADLHPGNVLVDGDHLAVIDFDDAAFGWHAYDLAVALVFYRTHAHYADFRDALVRGYRRVRPLADAVVGLLPMFLLIRGLVQLGWLHQRPEVSPPATLRANTDTLCERAARFEAPV